MGEVVVARVGWRTAPRVLGLMIAYSGFIRLHRRPPTIYEMAGEDDSRSKAQWYRDMEAFHKAFPEESSPERLAREMLNREGVVSAAAAFSLSAERLGVA